jgi:hypothetical protein
MPKRKSPALEGAVFVHGTSRPPENTVIIRPFFKGKPFHIPLRPNPAAIGLHDFIILHLQAFYQEGKVNL